MSEKDTGPKHEPLKDPTQSTTDHNADKEELIDKSCKTEQRQREMKEAYFANLNAWVERANLAQNAMALFPWYLITYYPQLFQNQASLQNAAWSIQNRAGSTVGTLPEWQQVFPMPTASDINHVYVPRTQPFYNNANNINTEQQQQQQQQQQQPQMPNIVNQNGIQRRDGRRRLGGLNILDEAAQTRLIQTNGGFEYIVAPFWKRAIAETIDILILLVLKIVISFMIINLLDIDLGLDVEQDVLRKALDDDDYSNFFLLSMDFLAFSSDFLLLEIITKIFVCIYEAIWCFFNNGATPGKAIMNLRIHYVEAVIPLQQAQPLQIGFHARNPPFRALIYPAEVPSFPRGLIRAIAKNLIITLLFPMCFLMIFFKNNRTFYDYATKTIVVETNLTPIMRRQPLAAQQQRQ